MRLGKKIILGLIAAVALDQTLRILSTWQFEGNTAFFEQVVAEADFESLLKKKGEKFRDARCKFHRSWVGYRVQTCFALRRLDEEISLDTVVFSLDYHEPRSVMSIMTANYYFHQLPGQSVLSADGLKNKIEYRAFRREEWRLK